MSMVPDSALGSPDEPRLVEICPVCASHISPEHVGDTLRRMCSILNLGSTGRTSEPPAEEPRHPEFFLARRSGSAHLVKVRDIDWIKSSRNLMQLHIGADVYILRTTMDRLEKLLDTRKFVRIHRTTIVNLERVTQVGSTSDGRKTLQLSDGTDLVISDSYRVRWKRFRRMLG